MSTPWIELGEKKRVSLTFSCLCALRLNVEESMRRILVTASSLFNLEDVGCTFWLSPSRSPCKLVLSLFRLTEADINRSLARSDQSMTRTLCQALANLVTSNEETAALYFPQRLEMEKEDQLLQYALEPLLTTCPETDVWTGPTIQETTSHNR